MVAVTKTAGPDQIRQLAELGHRDFGESRVQHLIQRVAQLDEFFARKRLLGDLAEEPNFVMGAQGQVAAPAGPPMRSKKKKPATERELSPIRWHMIGHLQRNKVKQVAPLVRLVHSIDSLRVGEELHQAGARLDRPLDVLLQVNISGEESKFGLTPPAVIHMAEQIDSMVYLRLRGLMTMAPYSENPQDARPYFARCMELFEEIKTQGIAGASFNVLSMGMSGDFAVAIEEGANVVRIGRALFGDAPPEDAPPSLPNRPTRRGDEEEEADLSDASDQAVSKIERENHAARRSRSEEA